MDDGGPQKEAEVSEGESMVPAHHQKPAYLLGNVMPTCCPIPFLELFCHCPHTTVRGKKMEGNKQNPAQL